jgi:hypothetical protein
MQTLEQAYEHTIRQLACHYGEDVARLAVTQHLLGIENNDLAPEDKQNINPGIKQKIDQLATYYGQQLAEIDGANALDELTDLALDAVTDYLFDPNNHQLDMETWVMDNLNFHETWKSFAW